MDARSLLAKVAEAYAALKSLSADLETVNESGDEYSSSRSVHLNKAYYVAPDKLRIEQGGRRGNVYVSDGRMLHTYWAQPNRYHQTPIQERSFLPGWFRPEYPFAGGAPEFLFHQINERVEDAENLSDPQRGIYAIEVGYESPPFPSLAVSPVTYWVDARTHLLLRAQAEISHRRPASDDITTNKKTVLIKNLRVDSEIPANIFAYTPPPQAENIPVPAGHRGGIAGGGGGGGSISFGRDKSQRMESWGSSEWLGETLLERKNLRLRGIDLTFERRLTFSTDGTELRVTERIIGPAGQVESEQKLPLG